MSDSGETYETPDYLRGVEPLPAEALDLVEQAETRELTEAEEDVLQSELDAACRRVRGARRERDGRD